MKISEIIDIVGLKKRLNRDPRKRRHIHSDDLYSVDPTKLNAADQEKEHEDDEMLSESRIQHIEDLILWHGSQGAMDAVNALRSLEHAPDDVTIKWDGSPAIVFGRNENGEFVLTDKSGFSAKGYDGKVTSAKDLEKMFLNRGKGEVDDSRRQFAATMRGIWDTVEAAVPADFRGYVHGDLLYFTTPSTKGGRYIFTPNTTTYSVAADSEIGQQVGNSDTGVVLHAHLDLEGNVHDVNVDELQSGRLLIMPPTSIAHAPELDIDGLDKVENDVKKAAGAIDELFNVQTLTELRMKDLPTIFYTYINNKTKAGQLDTLGMDFMDWLKSSKVSGVKQERIVKYIQQHAQAFATTFNVISELMTLKNNVIADLDRQDHDIEAYTAGQRGGEGYVIGRDKKLVNRSAFTQANMNRSR